MQHKNVPSFLFHISFAVGVLSLLFVCTLLVSWIVPIHLSFDNGLYDYNSVHIASAEGDGGGDSGGGSGDGGGDSGGGSGDGGGDGGGVCCAPPPPPYCSIISYAQGSGYVLSWSSGNATSASLSPGVGNVLVNASIIVTPSVTTTYTVSFYGPSGSTQCSTTIVKTPPPPPPPPPPAPYCTIYATADGYSYTLSWTSANATSASMNQGIGNVGVNGSVTVTVSGTTTYTLTVTGLGGTAQCSTTITKVPPPPPPPYCEIWSSQSGYGYTLTWTSQNATSASINQGIGNVATNGSITVNPSGTTTYTLTVTGNGGTATCSTTITKVPPPNPPSCEIWSAAHGEGYKLTWTSTNATSASINQGIGSVAVNGNVSVSPTQTTTYTLTVTGNGGTATCSTTITKVPPPNPPSCEIWSSVYGESYKLTWTSQNATSASINQGIGSVSVNGNISVNPSMTTTYTLTVTGPGGTANCDTTITKVPPPNPPACTLTVDPTEVDSGSEVIVSWTSTNATSVFFSGAQGGQVALNGSFSVFPTQTTVYEISAKNDAGDTVMCEVTVKVKEVHHELSCDISANPTEIKKGESSTLTWTSSGATTATISSIGSVSIAGSQSVSPIASTMYTLTVADGDGHSTSCSTNITVKNKPPKKLVCYWVPEDVEEEWNDDNEFDTHMQNAFNSFMQSHGVAHTWNPEVTLQD